MIYKYTLKTVTGVYESVIRRNLPLPDLFKTYEEFNIFIDECIDDMNYQKFVKNLYIIDNDNLLHINYVVGSARDYDNTPIDKGIIQFTHVMDDNIKTIFFPIKYTPENNLFNNEKFKEILLLHIKNILPKYVDNYLHFYSNISEILSIISNMKKPIEEQKYILYTSCKEIYEKLKKAISITSDIQNQTFILDEIYSKYEKEINNMYNNILEHFYSCIYHFYTLLYLSKDYHTNTGYIHIENKKSSNSECSESIKLIDGSTLYMYHIANTYLYEKFVVDDQHFTRSIAKSIVNKYYDDSDSEDIDDIYDNLFEP